VLTWFSEAVLGEDLYQVALAILRHMLRFRYGDPLHLAGMIAR
jgi:hypothetical protein